MFTGRLPVKTWWFEPRTLQLGVEQSPTSKSRQQCSSTESLELKGWRIGLGIFGYGHIFSFPGGINNWTSNILVARQQSLSSKLANLYTETDPLSSGSQSLGRDPLVGQDPKVGRDP